MGFIQDTIEGNTRPDLADAVLSCVRRFLNEMTELPAEKIPVVLTWRAWKTLELWCSGLALATQDQGALYDLRVTSGAAESVCAASFESVANTILAQTSTVSSKAICVDLNVDELRLLIAATNPSLRLFSPAGAHVGISQSLCVPAIYGLRDLVLIQATPLVFESWGFRDGEIAITASAGDLMICRGEESRSLSELTAELREKGAVGLL